MKSAAMDNDEEQIFRILVSHEEQYSIRPDCKQVPAGWRVGRIDAKQERPDYTLKVWTDMRPSSLCFKED
jgi:MbtH protein